MSEIITQLERLYSEYRRDMARITREQTNLRGAFARLLGGSAGGPGSDSCNDRFAEGVMELVEKLASDAPSSEDAAGFIGYVIDPMREEDAPASAKLMLQAVHGSVLPLVKFLSPAEAKGFADEYSIYLSGSAPLPVQKQLCTALKKSAERKFSC